MISCGAASWCATSTSPACATVFASASARRLRTTSCWLRWMNSSASPLELFDQATIEDRRLELTPVAVSAFGRAVLSISKMCDFPRYARKIAHKNKAKYRTAEHPEPVEGQEKK